MKRLLMASALLFLASTAVAVSLPYTEHFTNFSNWSIDWTSPTIQTDATSPDAPNVLRWRYEAGFNDGSAPGIATLSINPGTEIYYQYYFKYSSNWTFHTVENKHIFVWNGTNNFYTAVGLFSRGLELCVQGDGSVLQSNAITFTANRWYKVTVHARLNTGTSSNGIAQVWVDDVLYINSSSVKFWNNPGNIDSLAMSPVWGGYEGQTVPSEQFLYFDLIQIQTTPFGGGGGDESPPYASQWSPSKSSTGVLISNRTIQFHIQDDTDVLTANGAVNIEGTDYTCGAGVTCAGNGTNNVTVTYTKGSDWTYSQVVNVSVSGFRDSAGNTMPTDTWSYTIEEYHGAGAPVITTTSLSAGTVGTSSSQAFVFSGGTSPGTWSVISGTMPPGKALSSSGVYSGIPTTAGTYNFTVKVIDATSQQDNQALSQVINPATPGGQTTTQNTNFADTFINSGDAGVNYGSENYLETYQYPYATTSNRALIMDNADIVSLPADITITSATLHLYQISHEGSGATDPMRIYVYRTSGFDTTTVTWTNFSSTMQAAESYTDVALTTGYYSWTVTEAVKWAYANSSPLYLALDGGTDGNADTNRIFGSVDHVTEAYRPQLTITYTQNLPGGPPSIPAPGKMRVVNFKGTFR